MNGIALIRALVDHLIILGVREFPAEIISVIGIFLCVIVFYFYLQRLDIQLLVNISHQDDLETIPETKVLASTLPFTLEFNDEPSAPPSFKDGVHLELKTSIDCYCGGFWIVDCASLAETLSSNNALSSREFVLYVEEKLQDMSYSTSEKFFLNAGTSQLVHLKIGDGDEDYQDVASPGCGPNLDPGPSPRSKYPLVIMMSACGEDSEYWSHDVSILAMLWVVHLPDSTVTKPLHIISHMLITSQGLICDIQKMFMAADETNLYNDANSFPDLQNTGSDDGRASLELRYSPDSHAGEGSGNGRPDFGRSCVVCQNAPITCVIIPCRHACVCMTCLGCLNACPICRGVISSHFRLDGAGSDDGDESPSNRESDWKTRLWNMNEALNSLFGFR